MLADLAKGSIGVWVWGGGGFPFLCLWCHHQLLYSLPFGHLCCHVQFAHLSRTEELAREGREVPHHMSLGDVYLSLCPLEMEVELRGLAQFR